MTAADPQPPPGPEWRMPAAIVALRALLRRVAANPEVWLGPEHWELLLRSIQSARRILGKESP